MKKIINKNRHWLAVLTLVAVFQASCNEEFPNLLRKDYESKEMGSSLNKVLVVVVDGVRGDALSDIDPENLRKIARNSLYSNSSLGDFNGNVDFTKETGLANIFTGVTSSKHNVTTDLALANVAKYPTIFDYLNTAYPDFASKAFTTNVALKNSLLQGVKDAQVLTSDDEVLSKTKEAIQEDKIQMVVTHLSNVEKVGLTNSFESTDPEYKSAVLSLDNQISSLVETLQSRPNFKDENWLVVITSSVGGEIAANSTDQTVYGDNMRNTFTYFYSPRFTRKYQPKPSTSTIPFTGSGLQLSYGASAANSTSARLEDVSKVNFTGTQSFTITFFFKQVGVTRHNYPTILSKRAALDNGAGWQILRAEAVIEFGGSGISKITSQEVNDGKWHSITISVDRANNTAKIYADGVLSKSTAAGTSNLTNTSSFIFGRMPTETYNTGDFTVCNLQVYNIAMTDAEVTEYARLGLVKPDNSPFYNNLVGYWPTYVDVGTGVVTDVTGKSGNLKIFNDRKWTSFEDYVPYFRPDVNESTFKLVPNQVDIPFFIYQWYGVLPRAEWKLDGQAWTPPYAVLEY